MDWADMSGDERSRVCDHCSRCIQNLSELPSEARNEVLESDEAACIAYYLDSGGQPIHLSDLPFHRRVLFRMRNAFAEGLVSLLEALMIFLRRRRGCLPK